ncbi:LANO_0A01552g1_1 [Lachancea nothofagi CBS 11611]|uniref:Mannosyltransferase n=1 Tax=Lachancea nothofagi CBS 11611 TaxID=1266666 RepID=A0A1G4IML2_9SACH|nr:LANO_0A01552g1_1 [Lachancea nothofagi CBS 11611]
MRQLDWACDVLILTAILAHMYFSPYTKVEESFTTQAVHDILTYGVLDISEYDHLQYPGVVPRTFLGPLILAVLTQPLLKALSFINEAAAVNAQFVVRCVIGVINGLGLIYLKNQAQALFDRRIQEASSKKSDGDQKATRNSSIGAFFTIFCISQFHLMYYASRPLPNFVVALPLVNVSFGLVLGQRSFGLPLLLLSFASVVFRLELLALTLGLAMSLLLSKKIGLAKVMKFGALGAMLGASVSLYIDSFFWQNWTLPEMDAFFFNVVEGKSAKWGIMPFHTYLTRSLPMIFLPPTVLLLNYVGFRSAPKELKLIAQASYFHIFVLSFQPHKEWRFIAYTIPAITLVASCGASRVFRVKGFSVLKFLVAVSPLLSLLTSILFSMISSLNYPGGEALRHFNDYVQQNGIRNVTVHMDVPVCMTGVTLFGELDKSLNIHYDKTENLSDLRDVWPSFDFLITAISNPEHFVVPNRMEWKLLHTTKAFSGTNLGFFKQLLKAEIGNDFPLMRQMVDQRSATPVIREIQDHITSDTLFTFQRKNSNLDS